MQRGEPGQVLLETAFRPDDLLVVGAGRRGPLARMARSGKVSRYCLAHARCPVLAVPPPALAQEAGHLRLAWRFWNRTLTPDTACSGTMAARPLRAALSLARTGACPRTRWPRHLLVASARFASAASRNSSAFRPFSGAAALSRPVIPFAELALWPAA